MHHCNTLKKNLYIVIQYNLLIFVLPNGNNGKEH